MVQARNNNNNNNRNNYSRRPVEAHWPMYNAKHLANKKNSPPLGEVRWHRKTGLMYIYQVYKGRVGWWRLDTGLWDALGRFPWRQANPRFLRRFDRKTLQLGGRNTTPTYVKMHFG